MIKSIAISPNEFNHHKGLLNKLSEFNPVLASNDDTDFIVTCDNGDLLAIERKSPSDLLASIADSRLFNQAAKMKNLTQHCYVVITGSVEDCQRGWDWNAIQGALISMQQMGVVIVHCQGEDDFIPCIVRLANRSRDTINIKPLRSSVIFGGEVATLATIPGVGYKGAVKYLQIFKTLANTIMALCTPEMAKSIPGWGIKSAQTARDYFEWDNNNAVSYIQKEDENE